MTNYPLTIENKFGEKLIFKGVEKTPQGERLLVENFVAPGCGPIMHTHYLQDECLTVVSGKLGYQIMGEEEKFAGPGESVLFHKGTPHRFWSAGEETLHCTGWVSPPNTLPFFLKSLYAAMDKGKDGRPENFDSAYLMTRYKSEYDIPEIPGFVKKVIIPITYHIGNLLGKYKHFKGAPEPVRQVA
ncbi:MAG: cupin domain-containing protein [Bacteroidetes bacterium]|nr:cupin domain-containing protein [Bacteroidota bacterium]MCB0843845.1 cupin domain-containing protein [Bacteroidota bacterium]